MWCSLFSDLAFTLGDCRGFAYITIESTADNWKKMHVPFNGATWKGMTLKIQAAKPDYKQRQFYFLIIIITKLQKFSDNTIDEQSNKVRLEAIKQCALEKKAEKDKITQALRKYQSKNHIIFSDNDLAPEVSDNFNLFDSDEEYNNNEKPTLAINPIFEGESGRERLNLQKNFRCVVEPEAKNLELDSDHEDLSSIYYKSQIYIYETVIYVFIICRIYGRFHNNAVKPLPQVSKDVKIEINADLKGMFAPSVLKGKIDIHKEL
ncbi:hypothetical protein C2G38_2213043 [Gigaspora rosea]|uniref:Uncharacterized protein n=1 Tax=Gigaspora rosea TaxID=44941 RepID=A0A397UCI5_9GLOM|nr:hypothetical protein C2G38_2213043 [Gigaspora rosea]